MIIVSQSKRLILNFKNLTAVGISGLEDRSIAVKVYEENDKKGTTIARYATEERAKEILGEIIATYEHMKFLQVTQNHLIEYANKPNFVYEMPKE